MAKKIVDLDVREMLRAKQEPFQHIMESVNGLAQDEILQLHATFRPEPLFRVLGKQGFRYSVIEEDKEHFISQFYREDETDAANDGSASGRSYFHIDNRGLEPPQPMVRTLGLLENQSSFQNGEFGLEIWNERVPAILIPELEDLGYQYDVHDEGNGTVRVKIYHAK